MIHYQKVAFTHANLKRPVHIVAGTIAGWHWSDNAAATLVYTTAGIFPASETVEQVDQLIKALEAEERNGTESKSGT